MFYCNVSFIKEEKLIYEVLFRVRLSFAGEESCLSTNLSLIIDSVARLNLFAPMYNWIFSDSSK
jgi:hypothetical protein